VTLAVSGWLTPRVAPETYMSEGATSYQYNEYGRLTKRESPVKALGGYSSISHVWRKFNNPEGLVVCSSRGLS
jgi:hypothetical protein